MKGRIGRQATGNSARKGIFWRIRHCPLCSKNFHFLLNSAG